MHSEPNSSIFSRHSAIFSSSDFSLKTRLYNFLEISSSEALSSICLAKFKTSRSSESSGTSSLSLDPCAINSIACISSGLFRIICSYSLTNFSSSSGVILEVFLGVFFKRLKYCALTPFSLSGIKVTESSVSEITLRFVSESLNFSVLPVKVVVKMYDKVTGLDALSSSISFINL